MKSFRISVLRNFRRSFSKESFLNGNSALYIEETFKAWKKDPKSVHTSWDIYFRNLEKGITYQSPPMHQSLGKNEMSVVDYLEKVKQSPLPTGVSITGAAVPKPTPQPTAPVQVIPLSKEAKLALAARLLIKSYQSKGFIVANLDPLGMGLTPVKTNSPPDGIEKFADLEGQDNTQIVLPKGTFISSQKSMPLNEIVKRLKSVYCGTVGIEYAHNKNSKQRLWLRERVETEGAFNITKEDKKLLCKRLLKTQACEAFLAKRWPEEARFSIEGCDAFVPLMKTIIDKGTTMGIDTFIIGMCHRGRLNVLANVCKKKFREIFSHFNSFKPESSMPGDIIYNLGVYVERENKVTNKPIRIILIANPAHLEASIPVALGRTKSEQFFRGEGKNKSVMAIFVHNDAGFNGQGTVYELIQMSEIVCYTTGGNIHVVLSNQIGYTTQPADSRSCSFSSDIASKITNSPVLHLNAEDVDKVVPISKIAVEWRNQFEKDFIIDLIGYRRFGHYETDDPKFTNPTMYKKIESMTPLWHSYTKRCIDEGVITDDEVKKIVQEYESMCQKEYDDSMKEKRINNNLFVDSPWKGFPKEKDQLKIEPTGVKEEVLHHIGKIFAFPPPDKKFVLHKNIERTLKGRQDLLKKRMTDWSLGEAFAWGSLLKEGVPVRLTGQDADRGTFAHRHHILYNQANDSPFIPLANLWPDQATYTVCKSSLSEFAVMAYEVGYSMTNPKALSLWEAQFGDFATTAQVVLDLIICSGEKRWFRQCGIVLLLPHGLEGMGPEHSCSKPERYLQLCGDDYEHVPEFTNDFAFKQLKDCSFILANVSVPGNYFHIIRRQIAMPFRKPLVLLTPKSYLRHPDARSSFDEMLEGTSFKRVIPEDGSASKNPNNVKRLIFCTGRMYFEFKAERAKQKKDELVALTRIEQLNPFPYDLVAKEIERYPKAEICWAQEEHKNQGFYDFFSERFEVLNKDKKPFKYIGRLPSCCPASGIMNNHVREFKQCLADAFKGV